MHWIIQSNLKEAQYGDLLNNIKKMKCHFTEVKVFPFVHKFFPHETTSDQIDSTTDLDFRDLTNTVVIGSTTANKMARDRNISPGGFLTDNSDFTAVLKGYGEDNVLNYDATVGTMRDLVVPFEDWYFFIRPVKDCKAFSGMEMNQIQFKNWREKFITLTAEESPLHGDTEIIVATRKKIFAEYRFFVVNGKIASCSLYKQGNKVFYSSEVDEETRSFVEKMIELWTPAIGYVIDVAKTPTGYKVIELNALGSSGFYACDKQKIIAAIEELG